MENLNKKSVADLRDLLGADSAARAIIDGLFDNGTFAEIGSYVRRVTTAADNGVGASEFEGVITGYGAIDGRLTFAFVQDASRMKGAFGEAHAKKICALYDLAMKAGAPVIGVFDSNGDFHIYPYKGFTYTEYTGSIDGDGTYYNANYEDNSNN